MTENIETKEARRPKGKDVPKDEVGWSAEFLDWGCVPQGQDRRDPLLSPRFAEEAEAIAGYLVQGGERVNVNGEGWHGWVQGGGRWECFRRRKHAFTQVREWNSAKEQERFTIVEALYDQVGKWLVDEAFAAQVGYFIGM